MEARCWLGLTIWLGVYLTVGAQSSRAFRHLTVDDGLSHNTVYALLEDASGQIWAGTRFGLSRFDGYEWEVYLPEAEDSTSLGAFRILSLWEDPKGNIWVGHHEGGISVFDRQTEQFRRFPMMGKEDINWPRISVRHISQDSRKNIWIGTNGDGLLVYDSLMRPLAHFHSYLGRDAHRLTNDFVFDLVEDHQGRMWIGHAGQGIDMYDPNTDRVTSWQTGEFAHMWGFGKALAWDMHKQEMWVGTAGNGLFQLDLDDIHVTQCISAGISGLSHNRISDLHLDAEGVLWIATDGGGINRRDPQDGSLQTFRYEIDQPGTLNTDAIYQLMEDRHHNLWVGTFNGGVNLLPAQSSLFELNRDFVEEQRKGLRSVLAMQQDDKGNIWLGADGGGLFVLFLTEERAYELNKMPFPEVAITSMAMQAEQTLWLGTFEAGLFAYDIPSGQYQHYQYEPNNPQSLAYSNIWDIAVDSMGGLWIGVLGAGVDYLAPGSSHFEHIKGLSGRGTLDMVLDEAHGYLWVAMENDGLNRIDLATLEVQVYAEQAGDSNSLSSNKLRCLYLDKENRLWIGTEYAGLNQLDPKTGRVIRLGLDDGLPSQMVHALVEGPEGNLWVSTQAGIARWDPSRQVFFPLDLEPYLSNSQYNPKASLALKDGRLMFGTTKGYTLIRPDQVVDTLSPPVVLFRDLRISGQSIPVGTFQGRMIRNGPLNDLTTSLQLSYRDNSIQIDLGNDELIRVDKIHYAYRLTPGDSAWHTLPPGQRTLNFPSLQSGTYVLETKAAGPDRRYGQTRQLSIFVAPPFWETWWFRLSMILLGIGLIFGAFWFTLSRQRSRFQQQTLRNEQEILRLQNENLAKDIANQRARLSASLLQVAHKNKMLNHLKTQIQGMEVSKPQAVKSVVRDINRELKQEDYWEQFQLAFGQTHADFLAQLHALHPQLSDHERRLCCFIRMQLTNREIASILNITMNGVEQAKYRMKKKLRLTKQDDLTQYIRTIAEGK